MSALVAKAFSVVNGDANPAAAVAPSTVPSTTATTKTKKAAKKAKGAKSSKVPSSTGKKRRAKRTESYGVYIHKIIRQVHPEIGVSKRSMNIFESIAENTFKRITGEASELCTRKGHKTLKASEIISACQLVLPGSLCAHAQNNGAKALKAYVESMQKQGKA